MTRCAPWSCAVSNAAKAARNGTYTTAKMPAVASRRYPSAPSASRHTRIATAVSASTAATAPSPEKYAAASMPSPPTLAGISGSTTPRSLSAEPSSRSASTEASAITARNAALTTSSEAMITAPSPRPTPMAAGRLRPALPVALGCATGCSLRLTALVIGPPTFFSSMVRGQRPGDPSIARRVRRACSTAIQCAPWRRVLRGARPAAAAKP